MCDHPDISFKPVFSIDNNQDSLNTYERNLEWLSKNSDCVDRSEISIIKSDLSETDKYYLENNYGRSKTDIDILIGGPPCQGYSSSNRTTKKDNRYNNNKMMGVFMDRIDELSPKMFLVENVQGIQWTQPTENMNLTYEYVDSSVGNVDNIIPLDSVQDFLILSAKKIGYRIWYAK